MALALMSLAVVVVTNDIPEGHTGTQPSHLTHPSVSIRLDHAL
jgi:hypothetical protein